MNTPIELCHHLNYVRVHQTSGEVRRIPGNRINQSNQWPFIDCLDVGYNMYKKNYVAPTQSEGLDEIIQIEFLPKFDSETEEKIFHYYTES